MIRTVSYSLMNQNCLPNWKCANGSEYNIANSGTQAVLHEFNKVFFTSFSTTTFMKLTNGQRHAQISFAEFRVNLSKNMEITVTNYFTSGNKCIFHWADFYKSQTCSTTLCKEHRYQILWKSNKRFSHWYYITDGRPWSSFHALFVLRGRRLIMAHLR